MLMAALLLAVAQQDSRNVKYLGVRPGRAAKLIPLIVSEARAFVASVGFEEWCEQLNLSLFEYRTMEPLKALIGFNNLTSDDFMAVREENA